MGDGASAERAFHLALEAELPTVRQAVEVAMRRADPRWVRGAIRSLAASSRTRRLAIIAAGAFGDPAVVPWLIKECDDELIGGVAGEAVSMITGVDLRRLDLDRDAVEPSTSLPLEDQSLPQPDPDKLAAWWRAGAARYATGQRHLAGQPITSTALVGVLRTGYQRQRRAAAIELTTIAGAATLFRVGARADRQLRSLAP